MSTTNPEGGAPPISRAVLNLALLGDELARRTTLLKEAVDEHESAYAQAEAVADVLIKASLYDPDQRDDLLTVLRNPGGAMEVLEQSAAMIVADREAPLPLGSPVSRGKTASAEAPRPRGPGYGPRHVSDHPATLASNRHASGFA